ncbi:MAG: GNAT family N-acetyltransferase [Bacteroidota bacterium]
MKIVKATDDDLIVVMYFVKTSTSEMNLKGDFYWHSTYPWIDEIKECVNKGLIYLLKKNETVIGFLLFRDRVPEEYEHLNINNQALIINRLYIHPLYQNSREAEEVLLNFAEHYAKDNGYSSLMMNILSTDKNSLLKYTGTGYKELGTFSHDYQETPFKCLEKKV